MKIVFSDIGHWTLDIGACHREQFVYKCSFGLTGIVSGLRIRKIVYIYCGGKLVYQ